MTNGGYAHQLTDKEQKELLRISRSTLREFARKGRIPPGKPHQSTLVAIADVFVTLHQGSDLRGCIGTQRSELPLYRAVQEMTVAAASRDPRFPAVTTDEVPTLRIEISVLGERRTAVTAQDIEVGRHGLAIRAQGRSGLLLPQVAREHAWDAETFLAKTCAKAGLDETAWRANDATIETFTAQVFAES